MVWPIIRRTGDRRKSYGGRRRKSKDGWSRKTRGLTPAPHLCRSLLGLQISRRFSPALTCGANLWRRSATGYAGRQVIGCRAVRRAGRPSLHGLFLRLVALGQELILALLGLGKNGWVFGGLAEVS